MRAFAPPAVTAAATTDLKTRFDTLNSYFTNVFFPYLFSYFTEVNALNAINCNVPLTGTVDGVNTQFTMSLGAIRLASNGLPQAVLLEGTTILGYATSVALLTPGTWTLVQPIATGQPQTIQLGTAPAVGQPLFFPFVVLA